MGIHDYVWQFLPSAGDKVYGMNDSGWDIFAGTPFKSLAREICQNSLDVRKDHNKPVQVEFSIFELDSKEIPHIDDVKKALNSALNSFVNKRCKNEQKSRLPLSAIYPFVRASRRFLSN